MSSDDETEQFQSWKGIPATLICINIYGPCKAYSAQLAHTATCRMMRQYLRRASSQLVGVCVYGTEGSNTSVLGIQTVEEIFPLSSPSVEAYKKLRKVDISSLKEAKEMILSDVLWYCNKAFASCKKQLSTRTVIMLSRLDVSPVPTDVKPSLKRVGDLADSNIQINLINISESDYEVDSYYTDFLIQATKQDEVILPKPISNHTEVEQLMYMESHRNLAVARLGFEIGEGFAIGVGVYNLLKSYGDMQMKRSDLDSDTSAVLTSVNKTLKTKVANEDEEMDCDEQDRTASRPVPVLQSELLYSLQYGGENIEFTAEEKKMLGNPFGPPTLKLLGFKPASVMRKEKWHLKSNYFLFPSESIIEGSVVAFKALHQACTEMNKVAICVLCTRVNARPIIVALSPTSKPLGLDVDLGFDVICIPFIENVRNIPIIEDDDDDEKITKTDKGIMTDIMNQLKFDYKPDMFQNPKTQSLYNAIEAIALEDADVEPFIDTTKPNEKRFEGIQDDLFYEIFGPFTISSATLKKPASSSGGPESKRAKLSAGVDENVLKERLENNTIETYTVAQLKEILKYKEIPHLPALTGLRKGELVDLVYKYC
uniref:SFRICE_035941 n=1 Tax=Spodoptera frugiperda TaxID=7108 RepID=A0A2H1X3H1_SPOFR